MGCCEDGSCECGHNHGHDITIEDIVQNNNIVLNTLIDLLIQKGVISEQELRLKLADVVKDLEMQEERQEKVEEEIEEELEELHESDINDEKED
ncbi:MAG: hypothetical protein QXE31_03735 [Candidatus Woesearchaeota archaeon]